MISSWSKEECHPKHLFTILVPSGFIYTALQQELFTNGLWSVKSLLCFHGNGCRQHNYEWTPLCIALSHSFTKLLVFIHGTRALYLATSTRQTWRVFNLFISLFYYCLFYFYIKCCKVIYKDMQTHNNKNVSLKYTRSIEISKQPLKIQTTSSWRKKEKTIGNVKPSWTIQVLTCLSIK